MNGPIRAMRLSDLRERSKAMRKKREAEQKKVQQQALKEQAEKQKLVENNADAGQRLQDNLMATRQNMLQNGNFYRSVPGSNFPLQAIKANKMEKELQNLQQPAAATPAIKMASTNPYLSKRAGLFDFLIGDKPVYTNPEDIANQRRAADINAAIPGTQKALDFGLGIASKALPQFGFKSPASTMFARRLPISRGESSDLVARSRQRLNEFLAENRRLASGPPQTFRV